MEDGKASADCHGQSALGLGCCPVAAMCASLASAMRNFTAVVEKDPQTGLLVGYVPGWPGAHSQGATIEELQANLREVIEMLLEDGDPRLEAEFVGTATVNVA